MLKALIGRPAKSKNMYNELTNSKMNKMDDINQISSIAVKIDCAIGRLLFFPNTF